MYFDKYYAIPSLLWFAPHFHGYILEPLQLFTAFKTADTLQYLLCLWGIALSLLLLIGRPRILMNSGSYFILWLLYLSHFKGGDRFMGFQWDLLLLEAGFATIFFAPFWHTKLYEVTPCDSVAREILRFLGFRLLFASGIVKLLSKCKAWWSLSAMHYHFETQPLPHFLSWYAHQMTPDIVKRYMVVATFVFEILAPPLFYSPFREHRIFSSLANILLMASVIVTGNYNFFNILTSTVLLVILDDKFIFHYTPKWLLKALDIQVPMEQIVEEMKHVYGEGWCCTKFILKVRKGLSYAILAGIFALSAKLFPYDLVKEGKLPFTYEEFRAVTHNRKLMLGMAVYGVNVVFISQVTECIRWVNRNHERLCAVLTHAVSYFFLLIFGYGLAIA